ncbi:MAG TPA: hypothetical protein VN844_16025 [Pyrinomonadaceae bacterium]|nr:hypothetical protein [Pyrinomonadaceae bacterium]
MFLPFSHRKRTFWILATFVSSAAIASGQQSDRISVKDARPVASVIKSLETRFDRVITYEDPPLVHPDDTLDVTESVRRDLHKYAPGKAPRVIVPRGGELTVEFSRNEPVEDVLAHVLSESERVTPSTTFRTEKTNGIIHVIPESIKGPTGGTTPVRSILETPVQIAVQERTGIQMLEAWADAVSANSKRKIVIGAAPLQMFSTYKEKQGLSFPNARDALTEILATVGKGSKLSWQLFYDPGLKLYAINIYRVIAPAPAAQNLEAKLAQRADFVPAAGTVRDQLVQVAQHYKIPMGIEWVLQSEEKQVKLDVSEAPTVLTLLNLILQSAPEYSLTVREGVVNVSDSRYATDSRNFLNIRIGEFSLTNANVFGAEFDLRLRIHATLHPERYAGGMNGGYGYAFPDDTALFVKNISFAGKDLTVRNILDRIILGNGSTLWVVTIAPSRMMKKEDRFFAQFDSDQETDFAWKILPFNKSTQG